MWGDSCGWVRARLPLLADDDLVGADRRRARRHLIGCPDCRRRLVSLREALDILQGAGAVSPSRAEAPSLWPELDRQIRESRHPVASVGPSWPRIGFFSGVGLAAGLVVAVGLARAPSTSATRPSETVDVVKRPTPVKAPTTLVVHPPAPKTTQPAPIKPAKPVPDAPVVVQQTPPAKPTPEVAVPRRDEAPDPAQTTEPTR